MKAARYILASALYLAAILLVLAALAIDEVQEKD